MKTATVKTATVKRFKTYKYVEIFEITKTINDHVFKTKSTKKYLHRDDLYKLNQLKYTYAPLPYKITNQKEITLPLFEL